LVIILMYTVKFCYIVWITMCAILVQRLDVMSRFFKFIKITNILEAFAASFCRIDVELASNSSIWL